MIPLNELLMLKFPDADFMSDIQLADKGDGIIFINVWNLQGVERPTEQEIATWQVELDLQYRQNQVRHTRASLYPTWQQQLDMQYHDSIENTTTWIDAIEAIKLANPIPTE